MSGSPILVLHVSAGIVGIPLGAAAMSFRKGSLQYLPTMELAARPNQKCSFPRLCAWRSTMPCPPDRTLERRRQHCLVGAS
jgi:hypothetical protein